VPATPTPTHSPTPAVTNTPAPTGYLVVDLGAVDFSAESGLAGVNNSNWAAVSNFRYHSGGKAHVAPAPGQASATVSSIDSSEVMAGTGCGANCHATKWTSPAHGQDLGTLGGDTSGSYQISDGGVVVGYSDTAGNATTHAFRQSGGAAMVDLNTVVVSGPALVLREAWGINSSGTIVGWAGENGSPHAFILTAAGALSAIPALPGMDSGEARAINDAGHVTGFSSDGIHTVGFLKKGATLVALPTLAGYQLMHPYGINAGDAIVGCARNMDDDSQVHAFRYSAGHVVDLNSFLPHGSSWVLECATDINNGGTIVGTGRIGSNYHAFMLVPA
jgi:probable HAF family extracellular repeat protein